MTTVTTTLSYRPRGTDAWVDIDLGSTTGRRLLRAAGLTTSSEQEINTMSAQTMTATRPVSITVTRERSGVLVETRAMARRALDFIMAAPRRMWSSLVETFNLHGAQARIVAAGKIVGDAIQNARAWLGTSGQIGVGLGLIATPTGRAITDAVVAKPLGFLGRTVDRGIDLTVDVLDKAGRPGRWIGNQIENGRESLWAKPTSPIARLSNWAKTTVAPRLALDTWQMRSASDVSEALIGIRLMRLTISHSGLLMAGTVLAWVYAARGILTNTITSLWGAMPAVSVEATVEATVEAPAEAPVAAEASAEAPVVAEAPVEAPAETAKTAAPKAPASKTAAPKAPTKAEVAKAQSIKDAADTVIKEVEAAVVEADKIIVSANGLATEITPPLSRAARRRVERARRLGKLPEAFDHSQKIVGMDVFSG